MNIHGQSIDITYLYVPFVQKDDAKQLGARWDAACKQWYCPTLFVDKFLQWIDEPKKIWLNVKYDQRKEAKRLGAQWNTDEKQWYCLEDKYEAIEKYKPK